MNKRILFTLILLLSALPLLAGKNWYAFSEGMSLAESTHKPIVIDFYTDWCKWCKVMDEKTFSQPEAEAYLFEHFIPIRINAESNERVDFLGQTYTFRQLTSAFGVTGFPSLAYLTPDKKIITVMPGYVEKDMFINILKYIAHECYVKEITFDQFLKKGGC